MPWAGLSALPDPTQGSCMHLSWGAVSASSEGSSCCWVVLVWYCVLFTMILWMTCRLVLASETACLHQGKEILTLCSYFILRLAVCHRFPMLLICWRVHFWSLSLASLRYDFFFFCHSFVGFLWGFVWFFVVFSRRRFKCGLFPLGFVNPLEEFLYGPTCVEEIMLSTLWLGARGGLS